MEGFGDQTLSSNLCACYSSADIAAIYGVEQNAIVMELVEGEDLPVGLPLETALDYARQIAKDETESLSDPRRTLVQAIRHLHYVMECCGITKADLKVTPHGFRHQYAAEEYEGTTGVPPPVEGGPTPDKALDAAARQDVALKLGHWRPAISNAYLGRRAGALRRARPSSLDHDVG